MQSRRGISIIELLVVIALMIVVASTSTLILLGRRNVVSLENTTQQMTAVLREAQSRSIAQSSSTGWGVHFANSTATTPYFAMFAGSVFATSAAQGYHLLSDSVRFATSSLAAGATRTVSFAQRTGAASASTSIKIELIVNPSISSTIRIASSGLVSF